MSTFSTIFKLAKAAASVKAVHTVVSEVNKVLPAETRKKLGKTFNEIQTTTEEIAVRGLEKFAPNTVKKLTDRNAPKAATVEDMQAVLTNFIQTQQKQQTPAAKKTSKKATTSKKETKNSK